MLVNDLPIPHEDGSFVSAKIDRVVEAIKAYDSNIEVQWIPPAARSVGDSAFRLIYHQGDGYSYTMFLVEDEEVFDERVLQRIWAADQERSGSSKHSDIDLITIARKELKARQFRDAMEEAEDIARHVYKSHLHKYKVNDDLTIRG